jgi:hypothetical protein
VLSVRANADAYADQPDPSRDFGWGCFCRRTWRPRLCGGGCEGPCRHEGRKRLCRWQPGHRGLELTTGVEVGPVGSTAAPGGHHGSHRQLRCRGAVAGARRPTPPPASLPRRRDRPLTATRPLASLAAEGGWGASRAAASTAAAAPTDGRSSRPRPGPATTLRHRRWLPRLQDKGPIQLGQGRAAGGWPPGNCAGRCWPTLRTSPSRRCRRLPSPSSWTARPARSPTPAGPGRPRCGHPDPAQAPPLHHRRRRR